MMVDTLKWTCWRTFAKAVLSRALLSNELLVSWSSSYLGVMTFLLPPLTTIYLFKADLFMITVTIIQLYLWDFMLKD